MPFDFASFACILATVAPLVAAHGGIGQVTANGQTVKGPNVYFGGAPENQNTVVRVMNKFEGTGAFVLPSGFNDNSQMSCEHSANSPAPNVLSVAAGSDITVSWTGATGELRNKPGTGGVSDRNPWVHAMGTVQDYITSCNGDCSKFDATNAGWTKIAGEGVDMSQSISSELKNTMQSKPEPYHPGSGNGLWAMAKLVQQGSTWTINVPKELKSGQYIVRHELAAVHNPFNGDPTSGPQLYIGCIQIDVKGGGSADLPAGTQAKDLYTPNGDFANIDVNNGNFNPANFKLPGPAVWDRVSGGGSSNSGSTSTSSSNNDNGDNNENNSNNGQTQAEVKAAAAQPAPSSGSSGRRCKPQKRGVNVTSRRRHLGMSHH